MVSCQDRIDNILLSSVDGYTNKQSAYQWVLTALRCLPNSFYIHIRRSLNNLSSEHANNALHSNSISLTDILMMYCHTKFAEYLEFIYPRELEIKETTESATSASYLHCYFDIDNGKPATRLYYKRNNFMFPL